MVEEKNIRNLLNNTKNCPHFNDPPVGDKDIDFIIDHWVLCEFEDRCLSLDYCPLLPKCPVFPIIKVLDK